MRTQTGQYQPIVSSWGSFCQWIYVYFHSFLAGYFLLQELEFVDLSVVKADTIDKNLEFFYEFFLKQAPISYKNTKRKKSHSFIHFYGTGESCDSAYEQYQQALSNKFNQKDDGQLTQNET